MSNLNEEEIIKNVLHIHQFIIENGVEVGVNTYEQIESLSKLVDLYNKAQERINYLEDGLEEGKQIIGELRRLLDKEKEKK